MKNKDVAELLEKIANLLDIQGASFFKSRAYRLAAQTIMDLEENIETLVNEQRLGEMPGIGKALEQKITEYVTTGSLSYYTDLTKETPEELLTFLSIHGLGPKKVATLYHELHITTLEELRLASEEGKLRDLEGFGEITEKKILRGIQLRAKAAGRSLLHHAHEHGTALLSYLQENHAVGQISIAGSLRRRKETIGDIDILVSSADADPVMEYFVSYPEVKQVLLQGRTKTSVRLKDDVQVDLRIVEPKSYGAALQYFTGSKEHNVALRSLAIKLGYKLNEYGVFDKHTKEYVSGADEQEVYQTLHLPYIPPELRENRGEIAAAQQNKLPTLITRNDIKGDLHVHSHWSDGVNPIETLVHRAKQLGYSYIGITDHSRSLTIAHGLDTESVILKKKEIQSLNQDASVHVLCGTECDILKDGSLDYDDETLSLFDFVGIGIHSKFKMSKQEATERIIHGMQHPMVTFLAHPTCRIIGHRPAFNLDIEAIFETAVDTKTYMEINSYPDRLDLKDIYVKRGKDLGVQFVIGTDSHEEDQLKYIDYGIAVARRGWLEATDCLNTKSLAELQKTIGGKKARG